MATETQGASVKLRNVEAKVITGATPQELETNLRGFLEGGGQAVFLHAFQVGELAVLVLYAE